MLPTVATHTPRNSRATGGGAVDAGAGGGAGRAAGRQAASSAREAASERTREVPRCARIDGDVDDMPPKIMPCPAARSAERVERLPRGAGAARQRAVHRGPAA